MPKSLICKKFSTALEMINFLDTNETFWGGKQNFWVFRGMRNVRYNLIPSAFRVDAKLGHTHDPNNGYKDINRTQIDAELERITEFFWLCDKNGLFIPVDNEYFRTPTAWNKLRKSISKDGWPAGQILSLMALAQHYGIHTRLLDWSEDPFTAAYFAARPPRNKAAKKICIWALNLDWVINVGFPDNPQTKDRLAVYVVTAPRESNPYLHAQGGIFTTEFIQSKYLDNKFVPRTVNSLVRDAWKNSKTKNPVMVVCTLPVAERENLLCLVSQKGVNAATIFPGYKGVADYMYEREPWATKNKERSSYWIDGSAAKNIY